MIARSLALLLLSSAPAMSHDFYSKQCCSGRDCSPADAGAVKWTPEGWSVQETGEVISFADKRILYTPPGVPQFHICILPFARTVRCLYVPESQG